MARVDIPVRRVTRFAYVADASEVTADATNDHQVINDGATWVEVRNTNVASRTFDVRVTGGIDVTQAVTARTYTVPGSSGGRAGPFPREFYGETLLIDVATTDLRFTAYTLL